MKRKMEVVVVVRPSWIEFWSLICLIYSTRSTCDRLRTAMVLVDKRNLFISAGYNGSISGMPHCDEAGHLMVDGHCVATLHDGDNAIFNAIDLRRLEGSSAFCLYEPCGRCAKALIRNGVRNIYYLKEFTNITNIERTYIKELVEKKGIIYRQINLDLEKLIKDAVKILKSKGGVLHNLEKNS